MSLFLVVVPLLAVLIYLGLQNRQTLHLISVSVSTLMLAVSLLLTNTVITASNHRYAMFKGFFYVDSVSVIVLDLVLVIGFIASIYAIGYLEEEFKDGKIDSTRIKTYYILMGVFVCTMVLALTVNNMGIMWIAIEGTTLATVFLVGFHNDKQDIEAAWKYLIICSVGIAIALLGIIFLHLSSVNTGNNINSLNWTTLFQHAASLHSPVLKLAFVFVLVGFGTKAGLAPMHTWLPDAHSQAPSPISALLSGVLLNTAMYGIIRTLAIVNKNLGGGVYAGRMLMALGILSMALAALSMLTQKDYKRLLAYSSIEHMGIIACAFGLFTPAAIFGAFLHMINHSLTKSMLFFTSGNIYLKYNSKEISRIKGVLALLPVSGTAFLLGLFAISGVPPFSVFASEFSIIAAIFATNRLLFGGVFILLLALVFMGIALTLFRMFFGAPPQGLEPGEISLSGSVITILLVLTIAVMGLYLPDGITTLIQNAQKIIVGA